MARQIQLPVRHYPTHYGKGRAGGGWGRGSPTTGPRSSMIGGRVRRRSVRSQSGYGARPAVDAWLPSAIFLSCYSHRSSFVVSDCSRGLLTEVFASPLLGFAMSVLGFTEFYWVLPGFYWVLQGYSGFDWVLLYFTVFYWVLLVDNRFYGSLLGFVMFLWVLPSFTGREGAGWLICVPEICIRLRAFAFFLIS